MTAQTAADLRAAAAVLRRDGWTQLVPEDDGGRCCAIGAVTKVAGNGGPRDERAYESLHKFIEQTFGITGVSIWNDAPGRTADEVIAALEAAADAAEAGQ